MKVLVVGLGAIAQRHIRNIKMLEPSAQIAVWRQRPDPAGWQPPDGLPVDRWFYGRDEIWRWKAQAAVIANPATMHMATALHPVLEGLHLFIEKPMADALRIPPWGGRNEVDALLQLAQRMGHVIMVGYDLRFFEPLRCVYDAISSGRIGRPLSIRCEVGQYLPDWRPGRDYRTSVSAQKALGGGVLLELSHEIDYARWLMGEVVAVSAMTGRLSDLEIDVEDTADILLRFESGAMGSIHLDMVDRIGHRSCWVTGTEGSIRCDIQTGQTDLWTYLKDEMPTEQPRFSIVLPDQPTGPRMQWTVLHEGLTVIPDPFLEEMRHFLACCRGEAVPLVSGEDGRRIVEIVQAARRSAAEGRRVGVGQKEG